MPSTRTWSEPRVVTDASGADQGVPQWSRSAGWRRLRAGSRRSLGFLCALGAAISFGVQPLRLRDLRGALALRYVPVKKYEIFDGVTFQWFMCGGIFMAPKRCVHFQLGAEVGFVAALCFGAS